MSWVWKICPKCNVDSGLHVDKTDKLKDWGLSCTGPIGCGHHLGPGSYWYEPGGFKGHCESMGWPWDEATQDVRVETAPVSASPRP